MTLEHIASGPRHTEMKLAIQRSVDALQLPLAPADIAAGWSNEIRTLMVSSYEQVLSEISTGPLEPSHYKNWVKGLDHIDSTDRHAVQLLEDALAGERAIRDMQRAESFLSDVLGFLSFLVEPTNYEDMNTDQSLAGMVGLVRNLANRIQTGGYLQTDDFWAWDALLSELGCNRASADGGSRASDLRRLDTEVSPLVSLPSGTWWGRIAAFDKAFVDFASEDVWRS